jgi:hypothetical protein
MLAFGMGMTPYVLLAVIARWIWSSVLILICTLVLVWSDIDAGLVAMNPASSTNAVALAFQPLFATFIVLPITVVVAWFVRRAVGADRDDS